MNNANIMIAREQFESQEQFDRLKESLPKAEFTGMATGIMVSVPTTDLLETARILADAGLIKA